jgi:hypothetical protein
VVLRAARSRGTRLGRLVAGRSFALRRPGTLEVDPRGLIGATIQLRFRRRTRVAGPMPALGFAPRRLGRRYNRRWGYMLYLRRGAGTVRALDVDVDLRRHRVVDVYASFPHDSLDRWDPVPGPCPLAKETGGPEE